MRIPNTAIKRAHHPVPTLYKTLEKLKCATVFSKIDLKWGYHQIALHSDSRNITAFQDNRGWYRFKQLLFGVISASEEYNHIITNLFSVCPGVVSIFDYIIVLVKTNPKMMKIYIYFLKHLFKTVLLPMQRNAYSEWMKLSFLGSEYPKTEYIQEKAKLLQIKHSNHQITSQSYLVFLVWSNICQTSYLIWQGY